MKISDLMMMSMRSLWRRKLRTFLTILGVVIGASSIILMLSLGIAMNVNFENQMTEMQSLTIIDVHPNNYDNPEAPKMDDAAIEMIQNYPGVQMVIPERETRGNLEFGKYRTNWEVSIRGLSYEEMEALGYQVAEGEGFAAGDEDVILMGPEITREFVKKGQEINWNAPPPPMVFELGVDELKIDIGEYDWESGDPMTDSEGNSVRPPKPYKVLVKGMFSEEDWDNSYSVTVPVALYEDLVEEKTRYEQKLRGEEEKQDEDGNKYQALKVKVYDEDHVLEVQQMLNDAGYRAYSPMEYLEEMKKASNSIQVMLGGIGAISLFVAAIGITNTMMMSIYERTKEIGIMKVIGARLTDIKKMFLFEALMIGAMGGGLGVAFSYLLSYALNKFGPAIAGEVFSMMGSSGERVSVIPVWLAVSALIFSTLIGLLSGYFPAKRAMKLSALSAIKTE